MKLINVSGNPKVDEAIQYFNSLAPKIFKALQELPLMSKDFTYTNYSNWGVGVLLENHFNSPVELKIEIKKTRWPWSAAIGWTNGNGTLYINGWKIDKLSKWDIAGNIAHEFCHDPCGFSHGSNKIDNVKILSVPYAFGYLISGESGFPVTKYRPPVA